MARTGKFETRNRILTAAEECFSEKGYDGAGIEEISSRSGMNKALIYYYFKNKKGLLSAIYSGIMDEVSVLVNRSFSSAGENRRAEITESLKEVIRFLRNKKDVLKILLMESLKDNESESVFMELAGMLVKSSFGHLSEGDHGGIEKNPDNYMVYEFFTGFMPIYSYVVLGEPWAEYAGLDNETAEDFFIDSFIKTHLSHHNWEG